jgi:hypothetical protein
MPAWETQFSSGPRKVEGSQSSWLLSRCYDPLALPMYCMTVISSQGSLESWWTNNPLGARGDATRPTAVVVVVVPGLDSAWQVCRKTASRRGRSLEVASRRPADSAQSSSSKIVVLLPKGLPPCLFGSRSCTLPLSTVGFDLSHRNRPFRLIGNCLASLSIDFTRRQKERGRLQLTISKSQPRECRGQGT